MEGVAFGKPFENLAQRHPVTILLKRIQSVLRTGGMEPATAAKDGT
jgi:hypothetical protein